MGENSVEYQAGDVVRCDMPCKSLSLECGAEYVVEREAHGGSHLCLRGRSITIPKDYFTPVHPSKVGQRVRCLSVCDGSEFKVGDVGTVKHIETDQDPLEKLVTTVRDGDGLKTDMFAKRFIVISDTPPEPRIVEGQEVRVVRDSQSNSEIKKGLVGIVEGIQDDTAAVTFSEEPLFCDWVRLTDLEPVEETDWTKRGLSARYRVEKIDGETDPNAKYFVLRLDSGGSDPKHIRACQLAALRYADEIEDHIPRLADDLRKLVAENLVSATEQPAIVAKDEKFSEHLKQSSEAVAKMPVWKQTLLGGNPATEQPADSCVNTTSPTACGASVDTTGQPDEQGEEVPNDGPHRVRFYRTPQYRLVRGPIAPEDNLHYAELEGVTTPTDERNEQPIWVLRWSSPQGEWEEITPGEAVAMLLDVVWPNLTMEGFDVDLATKFVNRLLATEPHPCPYKKGDELIWTPGPDSDVQPVVFVSQNGDEPEYANVTMDGQNGQVRLFELSRDNGDDGEQPEPAPSDDGPRTLEALMEALGDGWRVVQDRASKSQDGRWYLCLQRLQDRWLVREEAFWEPTRQQCIDAAWDALHPARQRHQDGPFKFGQPVTVDGEEGVTYKFCCLDPDDSDTAVLVCEYGSGVTTTLSLVRPVPAPREYTLADLRELLAEGTQVWATSDQWGDWVRRATEALEATGRPFAEAAKEDDE